MISITDDSRTPLTEMADILKVDMRQTSLEQAKDLVKKHGPWRYRMLAEKVETREEFTAAKAAGFVYFQGYFFRRPEVFHAKENTCQSPQLPPSAQGRVAARVDVLELETIIKQEASVCNGCFAI